MAAADGATKAVADKKEEEQEEQEEGEAALRVTIIGAGIAGLSCALAMRHTNPTARVTLLEKSAFDSHRETGAALYVAPNASDHLLRLGWDPRASRANKCEGFATIDGVSGRVTKQMHLGFADAKWAGADGRARPWYLSHRVDLHNELKAMVLGAPGPGRPAVLHCGVVVRDIDVATGTVSLADGREFPADMVIGADGNASVCRAFVAPDARLKPYGKSCYRFLVDRHTLLHHPDTARFAEHDGFFADVAGPDRKIIMYPCRDNTCVNVACFCPDEMDGRGDDWNQAGSPAQLQASFASFWPAARHALSFAGDDLQVWQLMDMEPLRCWSNGRLALIGDAAHPFLPFLGQGAAQAIEDGVSLAVLLQHGARPHETPRLAELYDRIRRERVHHVQQKTRDNGRDEGHGRMSAEEVFAALDHCFVHDEWANTADKLQAWRQRQSGTV